MASCILDASETQAGTLPPANISFAEMETKKRILQLKKEKAWRGNICHAKNYFCFSDCYFWINVQCFFPEDLKNYDVIKKYELTSICLVNDDAEC